jgi:hypothetical protein
VKVGSAVYLPYLGRLGVVVVMNPESEFQRITVALADGRRVGVWADAAQDHPSDKCDCHSCAEGRASAHPESCDCQLCSRKPGRKKVAEVLAEEEMP